MKLIDKDALVAEIRKRLLPVIRESIMTNGEEGQDSERIAILDIIDALEVKEVDLELKSFDATVCKIGSTYLKEMDKDAIVKALEPYKDGDKVKVIIKATQKGE